MSIKKAIEALKRIREYEEFNQSFGDAVDKETQEEIEAIDVAIDFLTECMEK